MLIERDVLIILAMSLLDCYIEYQIEVTYSDVTNIQKVLLKLSGLCNIENQEQIEYYKS